MPGQHNSQSQNGQKIEIMAASTTGIRCVIAVPLQHLHLLWETKHTAWEETEILISTQTLEPRQSQTLKILFKTVHTNENALQSFTNPPPLQNELTNKSSSEQFTRMWHNHQKDSVKPIIVREPKSENRSKNTRELSGYWQSQAEMMAETESEQVENKTTESFED